MDPNETLTNLRYNVHKMDNSGDDGEKIFLASLVVDQFEALDGWLSKGGFLPDAWQPPKVYTGSTDRRRG